MKKLFFLSTMLLGVHAMAQTAAGLIPIDYYTLSISSKEDMERARKSLQHHAVIRSVLSDSTGTPVKAIILEKDEVAGMQAANVYKLDETLPNVKEIVLLRSEFMANDRFEIDRYLFMTQDSIVELPLLRNEYYDGINYVHELRFRESKNGKSLIDIIVKSRQFGQPAVREPVMTYSWDGAKLEKL
ncbi:hypothetical protein [Nonlabens ponticola]|uniref:Uncharacterized protein n=1 Tax=Nonlabens ponticola TaxID=2496866 RepID=A0A3S9MZW0_9FLAO|nr:hypothetical protein [Nonlabens ponticola]AZQ44781.1 hypothetical protein EJ995_11250 [Nonlabens ponticola]